MATLCALGPLSRTAGLQIRSKTVRFGVLKFNFGGEKFNFDDLFDSL
jgi:hypothetical protein